MIRLPRPALACAAPIHCAKGAMRTRGHAACFSSREGFVTLNAIRVRARIPRRDGSRVADLCQSSDLHQDPRT